MSKTITLTEHRPADGMLTMRVRNTTYNVNIFFNPSSKNTLDTQMRKIIQKEANWKLQRLNRKTCRLFSWCAA